MHVLNTLGPVFLIILLGVLLSRLRLLDANASRAINGCCYWVGLPCLLLLKIGTATATRGAATDTSLVLLLGTAVLTAVALFVGWLMKLKPRTLATFVHTSFRGNLAYVGLPVVYFAFSGTAYEGRAEAVAAITLGVTVVVYNVAAVLLHLASTHRVSLTAFRRVLAKLATNPLVLSCLVGLAWNHWAHAQGILIPVVLERTLSLLGQFALPMALICVGCSLATTPVRGMAGGVMVAALLKTLFGPCVAFLIARLLGVGVMETGIACVLLGAPSAVAAYVLTEQLDGDPPLAAGVIVTSTLLSAATLSLVVACIQ
ncbi:MAG: AEC family transporter [Verrucomicrobia bacterium]|nr:AEC family transporter [Verrucomicrobiota bacterium]